MDVGDGQQVVLDDSAGEALQERLFAVLELVRVPAVLPEQGHEVEELPLDVLPDVTQDVGGTNGVNFVEVQAAQLDHRADQLSGHVVEADLVQLATEIRVSVFFQGDVIHVHEFAHDDVNTLVVLTQRGHFRHQTHQELRHFLVERVVHHDVAAIRDFKVEGPHMVPDGQVGLAEVFFAEASVKRVTESGNARRTKSRDDGFRRACVVGEQVVV